MNKPLDTAIVESIGLLTQLRETVSSAMKENEILKAENASLKKQLETAKAKESMNKASAMEEPISVEA